MRLRVADDHEIASGRPYAGLDALAISRDAWLPAQPALSVLDDLKRRPAALRRAAPPSLAALNATQVHQPTDGLEADDARRVARAHLGRDGLVALDSRQQPPGRLVLERYKLSARALVLG